MYTRGASPDFDIRSQICGANEHNEVAQTNYDTINRMMLLIGDITFRDLYTKPWTEILPVIRDRIKDEIRHGLFPTPDRARQNFNGLLAFAEADPLISWQSYVNAGFSKETKFITEIHNDLF